MAEIETPCAVEKKGALRSRINWTAIIMILCSAVSDPMAYAYLGDWLPAQFFSRATFIAGWILLYFRNTGEPLPITNWKEPFKGATRTDA